MCFKMKCNHEGSLSSQKNKETTVRRCVFFLITASSRVNWQCVQMQSRMMSTCSCQIHWPRPSMHMRTRPPPGARRML